MTNVFAVSVIVGYVLSVITGAAKSLCYLTGNLALNGFDKKADLILFFNRHCQIRMICRTYRQCRTELLPRVRYYSVDSEGSRLS